MARIFECVGVAGRCAACRASACRPPARRSMDTKFLRNQRYAKKHNIEAKK